MSPDFSKNTNDTLAKRAAYLCSNPDCRVNTIGPSTDPNKSTKIGEAAHIYGARIGAKRYYSKMSDSSRGEITNAIWLCRNCHKLIDTDEQKYTANILFAWREKHEEFVASNLGSVTDQLAYTEKTYILKDFNNYPPIIKRIILDKPDAWEYRLTAELMRFLNDPLFRKLSDLKRELYLKESESIGSDKAFFWIQDRITELTRIVKPATGLLDLLTKSWGKPGEPGDVKEIHHVTKLIEEYLEHVVAFEERVRFVNVPQKYQKAVGLLMNLIGSQVEKFSSIPSDLDEIVSLIEKSEKGNETSKTITKEIVFDLPENWEKEFQREINKLSSKGHSKSSTGCFTTLIAVIIFIVIFF